MKCVRFIVVSVAVFTVPLLFFRFVHILRHTYCKGKKCRIKMEILCLAERMPWSINRIRTGKSFQFIIGWMQESNQTGRT